MTRTMSKVERLVLRNGGYQVGDLVMLKSGSPQMTIIGEHGKDCQVAVWDSTAGCIECYALPSAALLPAANGDQTQSEPC